MLPPALDVTDRDAAFSAVRQAPEHVGGLDIVANDAGYGHFGMAPHGGGGPARATPG